MKFRPGLRIKIIVAIAVSIATSVMVCTAIRQISMYKKLKPSYYSSSNMLENACLKLGDEISQKAYAKDISKLLHKLNDFSSSYKKNNLKAFITDDTGKVLYKSSNVLENKINIHDLLMKNYTLRYHLLKSSPYNDNNYADRTYFDSYHAYNCYIPLKNTNLLVIITAAPSKDLTHLGNSNIYLYMLLFVVVFSLCYYFLTNIKIKYIKELCYGISQIGKGNLHFRVKEHGNDELQFLANKINFMASDIENRIQTEKKLVKSKNELIVNVAHDIRTPLTTIIGYLGIIRDKNYKNDDELSSYVEIALNKSQRLKKLMDDLFTYTKLSSNGAILDFTAICLNDLLEQLIDEFVPTFEKNNLTLEDCFLKEIIVIDADIDKLVRVFENLFSNAIKYSLKPSKVILCVSREQNYVVINLSNVCDNLEKEDIENLFERFYMADKSRSLNEDSSGLGLAIAKSIVELHHGYISAELEDNLVSFIIKLPIKEI